MRHVRTSNGTVYWGWTPTFHRNGSPTFCVYPPSVDKSLGFYEARLFEGSKLIQIVRMVGAPNSANH